MTETKAKHTALQIREELDHGMTTLEGTAWLLDRHAEMLEALERLILFERGDEAFLESLADESASRGENASTPVWRERLIEACEAAIRKAKGE